MACISCEEYAKRISNIFKDEELKIKFESLTGLIIFNNLFICEECEQILLNSYKFKEKCTENYEKDLIRYDPLEQSSRHKSESILLLSPTKEEDEEMFTIETSKEDHHLSLVEEEHLVEIDEDNHLKSIEIVTKSSPRVRLRYTLKEKMKAIEMAEKSSNRQAAKNLSIDESCIRKWRHQKHQIKYTENQDACKLRKQKATDAHTSSMPDINFDDVIECEIHTTEIVDEVVIEEEEEIPKSKELKTRRAYSSSEKLEVVAYAEITGNRQAAKAFKIDESCIRKWRNQKDMLIEINRERGTKRKPNLRFPQLETRLKSFVMQKLENGIILKPSEIKAESIRIAKELNVANFKGTSSYVFKFMERYKIKKSTNKSVINDVKE